MRFGGVRLYLDRTGKILFRLFHIALARQGVGQTQQDNNFIEIQASCLAIIADGFSLSPTASVSLLALSVESSLRSLFARRP